MDEKYKKKLQLLIIDKILFGFIILAVSYALNIWIENHFREAERRAQVAQSVSTVFTDVIVEERGQIKVSMERFLGEVNSYVPHADPDIMKFKKLQGLLDEINDSIELQIGEVAPDFLEKEDVKSFTKALRNCKRFLQDTPPQELLGKDIKKKLNNVREAYKKFLRAIREVSIDLALKDYKFVKDRLDKL